MGTKTMTKGGKRKGAGRKPAAHGPTAMLRVPLGCMALVKALIAEYKASCKKG